MPEGEITLRELLEAQIQTLAHLGQMRAEAADKALHIQALEYERRLEILNHAHEDAQRKESLFVSREAFDQAFLRLQTLEQHRANMDGRLAATAGVLFGTSVLINLAITVAGHFLR